MEKITVVGKIRQAGGDVRYLLDGDTIRARRNRAAIRNTGTVEAADPEYIVDMDCESKTLRAIESPTAPLTEAEWSGIWRAIKDWSR